MPHLTHTSYLAPAQLWNTDHARVEAACRESLSRLGLSYIDLYLMHWPVAGNEGASVQPPLVDTWRDMEALVDAGLVRALGVSNFSVRKLEALLAAPRQRPVSVVQAEVCGFARCSRREAKASCCSADALACVTMRTVGVLARRRTLTGGMTSSWRRARATACTLPPTAPWHAP
jgi:aryl-alcohol dehydrogenase-like predicted oxidoreductase